MRRDAENNTVDSRIPAQAVISSVKEKCKNAEVISNGSDGVRSVSGAGGGQVRAHEEEAERAHEGSDH